MPKEETGRFLGIHNLAGTGFSSIGAQIGGSIAGRLNYLLRTGICAAMALLHGRGSEGVNHETPG